MKTKAILISILFFVSLIYLNTSHALRCNGADGRNYIVSKGDYHFEVMRKCGKPMFFGRMGGIQSDVEVMSYIINDVKETLIFRMGRLESESSDRL